ncbi:hypothetical protein AX23_07175 [Brucella melitensis 548]|nr:hypothetical protein AX23_07175 [Brucella melitensis 548]
MKPTTQDLEKDSAQVSSALVRGLEILRSFTPHDLSLGNQELIDRTGLPKATVSRMTATLVNLGYLDYDEMLGRYRIGPATIALGYSGLSANVVVHIAMPLMRKLAEKPASRWLWAFGNSRRWFTSPMRAPKILFPCA